MGVAPLTATVPGIIEADSGRPALLLAARLRAGASTLARCVPRAISLIPARPGMPVGGAKARVAGTVKGGDCRLTAGRERPAATAGDHQATRATRLEQEDANGPPDSAVDPAGTGSKKSPPDGANSGFLVNNYMLYVQAPVSQDDDDAAIVHRFRLSKSGENRLQRYLPFVVTYQNTVALGRP